MRLPISTLALVGGLLGATPAQAGTVGTFDLAVAGLDAALCGGGAQSLTSFPCGYYPLTVIAGLQVDTSLNPGTGVLELQAGGRVSTNLWRFVAAGPSVSLVARPLDRTWVAVDLSPGLAPNVRDGYVALYARLAGQVGYERGSFMAAVELYGPLDGMGGQLIVYSLGVGMHTGPR